MPKMKLFASHDKKAEQFMQPFCAHHAGIAVRGFEDAILRSSTPTDISNHPEDFDLYELGEFDGDTGRLTPLDAPQMILQGSLVTKS